MRKAPLILAWLCGAALHAQTTVATDSYDLARTGVNPQESVLKPSNVDAAHFGKLFSLNVDASVYARPLIIPGVEIDGARHNLLYIATMANTVYAFDADDASRAKPYWSRNLGRATPGSAWLGPKTLGIVSTPHIDVSTGTLYTVTKFDKSAHQELWVHALDIRTGEPKYNSPQRISFPFADGTTVTDTASGLQRPGIAVVGDTLVLAFSGVLPGDMQEGFIESFDAHDLSKRRAVFQVTPTGLKGGIWQAGRGVAADEGGSIYVATAGGDFDGTANFGSSIVKLKAGTLTVQDYFTPRNHEQLFHDNVDLSGNGVTLIPHTSLAFAGGKEGVVYLLNRTKMGGLESATSAPLQQFRASSGCGVKTCSQTLGTAFWSNSTSAGTLFVWDKGDVLRAYRFRDQRFETTPSAVSSVKPGLTSGPSVSWDGSDPATGIVWAVTIASDDQGAQTPGTLRAFLATDVSKELYNSDSNKKRDGPGNFTKFAPPVVANGKVYVISQSGTVAVYGLLH